MSLGKAKSYSTRDIIRILIDNGYKYVSCNGSHKKFEKDGHHIVVNVCSKDINMMMARRIIKENNLRV